MPLRLSDIITPLTPKERSKLMPRPVPKFRDFIGQKSAVDLLRRQLAGAQTLREPFPHTLFTGPSGIGKTRLAEALAAESGTRVVKIMGHLAPESLVSQVTTLQFGDFLFIDEAQNLKPVLQEMLLHLIDDRQVSAPTIKTPGRAALAGLSPEQRVEPHTIILATDRPGSLLNALQKRMALQVSLALYDLRELKEIVDRQASDMDILISPQAARLIAQVSAGLPRRAKHHLENLRRHMPIGQSQEFTLQHVRRLLAAFRIDDQGLGERERDYLSYLAEVGSASLESLALYLGIDSMFVRQQIEPVLQRQRLIVIGPSGRKLTASGQQFISNDQTSYQEDNA
jgi:Holliday junction DNA helicase RuvB